jgi:hypothetical protein
MIMETNIASVPAFQQHGDLDAQLRSFQAEQARVAALTTSRELDVSLVTREGDTVTISLDARAAALYGKYERVGMNEAGATYQKSELTAALYEREMTFTVEGDLNPAERRDIRKALKTLDRMMHNFTKGHARPMMMGAKRLQGLDTIAGLDASFSYERQVLVAEQTRVAAEYGGATRGTAPDGSQPPEASQREVSQVAEAPALQLLEAAGTVADEMARVVDAAETPVERMLSFVDQLMEDYRERMSRFDAVGSGLVNHIAGRMREMLAGFDSAAGESVLTVS